MYTGDETDLDADRPQSNLCEKEKIAAYWRNGYQ